METGTGTGRALLAAAGGWLAGIAWQLQQASLPAPALSGALVVSGLIVGLAVAVLGRRPSRAKGRFWQQHQPTLALALWFLAAAACGFGLTSWRAEGRLAQGLAPAVEGRDLWVTGLVASLPQDGLIGIRFRFEVEQAALDGMPAVVPPVLALGWYRQGLTEPAAMARQGSLRAGQRWRLPLRLRQPHGSLNPHGFDYELWLFEAGVQATGTVRDTSGLTPVLLQADAGAPLQRLRQWVRDGIQARVTDPALAGVVAALAIGDQAAIDRADWDLFRHTGVAHLMSISGLHVTMFAWLAAGAVALCWRRSGRAMTWCATPVAARWGGLALAMGYAALAGWGVPAQRTVLMLATVTLLRQSGWHWPWTHVLLTAAVAVTAMDPWALLQPGFWLSFAAVGLLMASEPARGARGLPAEAEATGLPARARRWLAAAGQSHLRSQAIATAGLAPLSLVCFQQVSVVGFVANLLAIPFVTLLLAPVALAGMVLPPLWSLAAVLSQGLTASLAWMATWPIGVWTAAAPPAWAILCGGVGAVLAVAPLPLRLRLLALPLILPLLAPPLQRPPHGQLLVLAADVGQGTAVLLRTRRHLLLYDAGPQYSLQSDAGSRVLVPLLRARGERSVDLMMLSHRDTDHVGGAAAILDALPVRALSSSLEPGHALRQRGPVHRDCADGQAWVWDGVRFEVLHPGPRLPDAASSGLRPNTLSCVLKVTDANGRSVLLAGDIEAIQESALVHRHGARLRADILIVPHHGSRTSSTAAFLDAVQPETAVFQHGYRSRFGHPAPDVVRRYEERGISVVRSDRCGAWTWHAGEAECTRAVRARYWHWSAAGADVARPQAQETESR
ncbi:MAG: DNA internalization-related competence protein ComEC/Rec2 [Aquabacterium sp.]